MSQETFDVTSRALSTARFLLTSQSFISEEAREKRRTETWDAAKRQVIRMEVPVLPVKPDLCTPTSRGPSKPSLMDIISGKPGTPDPLPRDSTASPTSSTRTVRSSLTGYQWGGGASGSTSPASAAKVGEIGPNGPDKASAVSSNLRRASSCDVPQQNLQVLPDGQQRVRKGVAGRRHSVQILEQHSADTLQQMSSPKGPMSQAAASDGPQHVRKSMAARRHSLHAHVEQSEEGPQQISSPKAQMSQGAGPDAPQHVQKAVPGRRHSLHILRQQSAEGPQLISSPKPQMPQGTAPDGQQHVRKVVSGRRHSVHIQEQQSAEGTQQIGSPKAQMYSAASIAAVGRLSTSDVAVPPPTTAAVSPGKVMPLKLHLLDDPAGDHTYLKSKSTPILDAHHVNKLYRSQTALIDGHAGRISSSSDGGTETEGSMSGATTIRRYVPSIDKVDKQALQRGGEGDCTAYGTLLDPSLQSLLGW